MKTKFLPIVMLCYVFSISPLLLFAQNCDSIPVVYPVQYYPICEDECLALISTVPSDSAIFWTGPPNFNHLFFCAENYGLGPHEFVATSVYNDCISTQLFIVDVYPYIEIPLDTFAPICETAEPLRLPTVQQNFRGNWSGEGVIDNVFFPLNRVGTVDLTFTPDTAYCATIDTAFIKVKADLSSTNYFTKFTCDPEQASIVEEQYNHSTGCGDSLVITEYILVLPDTTYLNQTTCDSNQAGVTLDIYTSSYGCDSMVLTDIVWIAADTTHLTNTTCDATAAGFTETYFSNTSGCDSIVILETILLPNATTTINRNICHGATFELDEQVYQQTGTYTYTLPAANGCDSILTLNLVVENEITTYMAEQICAGEVTSIGENNYHETGLYSQTFSAVNGCDSTVILDLIVNNPIETYVIESFCEGGQISVGNDTFDETGNYSVILPSVSGCDSLVNVDLTVFSIENISLKEQICEGETFEINGQAYHQSGTHTNTLTTSNGCDSILTLHLEVFDEMSTHLSENICEGETILIGNTPYVETGSYTQTLTATNGCDSTVYLDLTVFSITNTTLNEQICHGESFEINGQTYHETGNYTQIISNSNACDSILTLHLEVFDNITTHLEEHLCEGDVFFIGNTPYHETGFYTQTLTTTHGCDSTVYVDLTVTTPHQTDIFEQICVGDCFYYNDSTLCETGTYSFVFENQLGCDSIINIVLQAVEDLSFDVEIEATCFNDNNGIIHLKNTTGGTAPYLYSKDGDIFQTTAKFIDLAAGNYLIYIQDSEGCTITTIVDVPEIPAISTTLDSTVFTCGSEGLFLNAVPDNAAAMKLTYQWQDESTQSSYYATYADDYWVDINNTCHTVRKEFSVINEYLSMQKQIYVPNAFSPNNDGKNDVFKPYTNLNLSHYEFYISDRWGNLLFQSQNIEESWDGYYRKELMNGAVMAWWMKAHALDCNNEVEEVLMKGYVTIVR